MSKITKDTTLAEILQQPGSEEISAKYKVPCLTCPMAKMEMDQLKLSDICASYGIDLAKLLKELNRKFD